MQVTSNFDSSASWGMYVVNMPWVVFYFQLLPSDAVIVFKVAVLFALIFHIKQSCFWNYAITLHIFKKALSLSNNFPPCQRTSRPYLWNIANRLAVASFSSKSACYHCFWSHILKYKAHVVYLHISSISTPQIMYCPSAERTRICVEIRNIILAS